MRVIPDAKGLCPNCSHSFQENDTAVSESTKEKKETEPESPGLIGCWIIATFAGYGIAGFLLPKFVVELFFGSEIWVHHWRRTPDDTFIGVVVTMTAFCASFYIGFLGVKSFSKLFEGVSRELRQIGVSEVVSANISLLLTNFLLFLILILMYFF